MLKKGFRLLKNIIAEIGRFSWKFFYIFVQFVFSTMNIVPNFQINKNLNLIQNIMLNFYLPNSKGELSMHSTLTFYSMVLVAITILVEVSRYIKDTTYMFSTGFWTILGTVAGIITLSFTFYERKKLSQEITNSAPEVPYEKPVVDYSDPEIPLKSRGGKKE